MPEAASRWPILVFTEPIGSGCCRTCPSARPTAAASIGSPAGVPVPCISKNERSSGATPALLQTDWISVACAVSLGIDSPIVRPSGHRGGVAGRRIAETQIAVIGRGTADIDTCGTARELAGRDARILDGMPDEFEQQSLLRIHLRRLARRDPEKRRLEQIDAG